MKNKLIYVALAAVLIVCTVTGCTAQTANKGTGTVTDTVSEKSETVTDNNSTSAVSAEGISKEDNQESDEKNESEQKEETTTTKNSTSNSSKNSKTTHGNTSTTTKKSSSAKETTTKKTTTTKKQTTTKKVTTTEEFWNCEIDGHTAETGQIGWVGSFDTATDKALEYIGNHNASGNFRVVECFMCGKYTAYITLD